MAPRRRTTDEFSILNMNEDIRDAAQNLLAALEKQGVSANADMIFMGIQTLISQAAMTSGNSMLASDTATGVKGKVHMPYSMTADFFATAFENFHNGDKKKAVGLFLQACELDDADALIQGLATMNSNSAYVKNLMAEESGDMAPENPEGEELGEELSPEDIDNIIEESEAAESSEGEGDGSEESGDGESETDDSLSGSPMDPEAPAKPVMASDTPAGRLRQIMARKASESGSHDDRQKGRRLMGS